MDTNPAEAPHDCPLCPRLVAYREANARVHPDWFNGPVPSFGPTNARLLIVGLAPGVAGANRTGRPFTGDFAGDLLYSTLREFGFSKGIFKAHRDDGLELVDVMISNAVRCVPPQNKPTPLEEETCRPFLVNRINALPNLKVILALGRVAHDNVLSTFGARKARFPFGHKSSHDLKEDLRLFDSYHCSRYNTNTGRLTTEMFHAVFEDIKTHLDAK
ncbi:MAG: uracil-DNA glycosylase [Parvibaculum sp.]|nr:uracil-DNA glycosylase [Parvibaculum sp.]